MKHGAKVTLICQTAKIGVGCLLFKSILSMKLLYTFYRFKNML